MVLGIVKNESPTFNVGGRDEFKARKLSLELACVTYKISGITLKPQG